MQNYNNKKQQLKRADNSEAGEKELKQERQFFVDFIFGRENWSESIYKYVIHSWLWCLFFLQKSLLLQRGFCFTTPFICMR